MLDYIADQVVGISFFDRLQGLKIANRLGLSWCDDAIGRITQSSYFDDLAGQFIDMIENTIRNLDDVRQL